MRCGVVGQMRAENARGGWGRTCDRFAVDDWVGPLYTFTFHALDPLCNVLRVL